MSEVFERGPKLVSTFLIAMVFCEEWGLNEVSKKSRGVGAVFGD